MTIERAYAILGVNSYCSDEELKRRYRLLARKYHPDLLQGTDKNLQKANEKMQEINEAYEFIQKQRKRSNRFDLEAYKRMAISQLEIYYYAKGNVIGKDFNARNNEIRIIIDQFANLMLFCTTKDSVDNYFQRAKSDIRRIFEGLKRKIYLDYAIDDSVVKELLNYECNLWQFNCQLTEIMHKYSPRFKFEKELEYVVVEYKLRSGYIGVKNRIQQLIQQCSEQARELNYLYSDKLIEKLKKDIEYAFECYFKIEGRLRKVKEFLDLRSDSKEINELRAFYDAVNSRFVNGEDIDSVELDLGRLELLIKKQLVNEKMQERDNYLRDVTNEMTAKYMGLISNCENIANIEFMQKKSLLYGKVLEYIKLLRDGTMPMELVDVLRKISFTDDNNDLKQTNVLDNFKEGSRGIYVLNRKLDLIFEPVIGEIVKMADDHVILRGVSFLLKSGTMRIEKDDFLDSYIPLEQFMRDSEFGIVSSRRRDDVILYHNQFVSLVYDPLSEEFKIKGFSNRADYHPVGMDYESVVQKYRIPDEVFKALQKLIRVKNNVAKKNVP